MIVAENSKGRLEFINDELIITSKTSDAGKLRFHSPNGTMGAISFCDEFGGERVLVMGSRTEGLKIQGNATGNTQDSDMKPLVDVSWNGARFQVPIVGQQTSGRIALKAVANNRYVCAENEPGRPLLANRDGIGAWEQFDVVPV